MKDMKYVMNKDECKFLLIPDIGMKHSDVVGNWTSAGFVSFHFDGVDECGNPKITPVCYGESVSLGLKSHVDDSKLMFISMKNRH